MAIIYNIIEIMETNKMIQESEYIITYLNSIQFKKKQIINFLC